ncbi:hypothetical protein B0H15DRAFT_806186 [Mycena belliarum]|uniref:Uncharacterized protein n=1 Tax=Mycena belliarum TaxID=1033014 RepID=A0AAD6TPK8_9AGAR|nr:hypothetical protein B0H15DRAFT_806186 [Mycena belliae]
MSFYQSPYNGNQMGGNSVVAPGPPSQKQSQGRTMQVTVNLVANQSVEVRLNADSPWIMGLVLAVLTMAERNFGVQYEIRYQTGVPQRPVDPTFDAARARPTTPTSSPSRPIGRGELFRDHQINEVQLGEAVEEVVEGREVKHDSR